MKAIFSSSLLAVAGAVSFSAQAVEANFQASILVYGDPSSSPRVAYEVPARQNLSYYTRREVADDVFLSGADRVIAGVNFEYYSNFSETGGLTFRMYDRNESGVPGSLIYSKPLDILQGGGIVNIAFNYDATNLLPQRFFYSVQFSGVDHGQVAGMIVPNQVATTGYTVDGLLEKRGNNWLPLDLNANRGRRVGLARDGNRLRVVIVDAPRTTVSVESSGDLSAWTPVAEVETDDNGDAEYEQVIDSEEPVFFRTLVP